MKYHPKREALPSRMSVDSQNSASRKRSQVPQAFVAFLAKLEHTPASFILGWRWLRKSVSHPRSTCFSSSCELIKTSSSKATQAARLGSSVAQGTWTLAMGCKFIMALIPFRKPRGKAFVITGREKEFTHVKFVTSSRQAVGAP